VCGSLEEAVGWAVEQSESVDNIVLSPGCASYDWFRSFRERGDEFTRLVGGTYSGTLPSAPGTSRT
jgi:UDP-N-acetylmuramoylalanine--D-glutamate ligase